MMVVSLTRLGQHGHCLTQTWVNNLGVVAVLVGTATAIAVGALSDRVRGRVKLAVLALLTTGGGLFTLLSLISRQVLVFPSLPSLQAAVYLLLLAGNACVVSCSPLLVEFGVEKLYPISEGMVGGWLNIW